MIDLPLRSGPKDRRGVPLAGTSLLGMTSADIENIFGVEISMKIRATQAIMECLLEQEVDTVFGYPGGTILNVYDELYNYKDKIHHVLTAHEQGASHAADGYARATGKVGVCFAPSGPGATNLTTGIAVAHARGGILYTAERLHLPVYEYTPMQIKQAVVGYGLADKHQVMDMTRRLLKLRSIPRPDDAADALAIAMCHARSATSLLRRKDPDVKETV